MAVSPPKATSAMKRPGQQSANQLRDLQRLTGSIIMNPLNSEFDMQHTWHDGRPMEEVIGEIIAPNDRLSSFERLEIYNKQYWFRLIDCLYDDFPGLVAVLGSERFSLLSRAYLTKHPSRSFTLRNLASHMVEFLLAEPKWGGKRQQMAVDMARFEWAQIIAFDEMAYPAISAADLQGIDPNRLKLSVQPYVTLLDLAYPLDDFTLSLRTTGLRGEASNAIDETDRPEQPDTKPARLPRRKETFIAVHRLNNELYFKRLEPAAYRVLAAFREGHCLGDAVAVACRDSTQATVDQIGQWFTNWTAMGWFYKSKVSKSI